MSIISIFVISSVTVNFKHARTAPPAATTLRQSISQRNPEVNIFQFSWNRSIGTIVGFPSGSRWGCIWSSRLWKGRMCWALKCVLYTPPPFPTDSNRLSPDPANSDGLSWTVCWTSNGFRQTWPNSAACPVQVQWKSSETEKHRTGLTDQSAGCPSDFQWS